MTYILRYSSLNIVQFVLIFSPLIYASNRLTLWFLNGALVSASFLFYLISLYKSPAALPAYKIKTIVWLFCIVIGWIIIQWLPLDNAVLSHPSWQLISEAIGEPLKGRITVSPIHTQYSLIPLITNGMLFWLIMQFSAAGYSRRILYTLFCVSFVYVTYAFLCWFWDIRAVLWYPSSAGYGTFLNVNMLVIYTIMASLLAIYLSIDKIKRLASRRNIVGAINWINFVLTGLKTSIYAHFFIILIFTSMIFVSGSRGGFILYLLSLSLFVLFYLIKNSSHIFTYIFYVLFLIFFFMIANLLSSYTASRFLQFGLIDEKRVSLYNVSWNIIQDHALYGTGYGSFQVIFPLYRNDSFYWEAHYDKAHNTLLELMVELGIPATFLLLLCVFIPFIRVVKKLLKTTRNSTLFILVTVTSIFIFLQSLIYFHIQIQAIAFFYLTILAIGYEKSLRR